MKSSTAEKEWIYGKGFARKRNLKLDLFGNEVGHKYYFATFEYFRVGRHKSWHKSRDPHFSLAFEWKTLFNTFKTINFLNSYNSKRTIFWKLTEIIFALGLRLSCQTTMKLGKMQIIKQIQSLELSTKEEKIYLIRNAKERNRNTLYKMSRADKHNSVYVVIGFINMSDERKRIFDQPTNIL